MNRGTCLNCDGSRMLRTPSTWRWSLVVIIWYHVMFFSTGKAKKKKKTWTKSSLLGYWCVWHWSLFKPCLFANLQTFVCNSGYECRLVKVTCSNSPCLPITQCVPLDNNRTVTGYVFNIGDLYSTGRPCYCISCHSDNSVCSLIYVCTVVEWCKM